MEEKSKRKINVEVAGMTMSLIADEAEEFTDSVIKQVNEDMDALMNKGAKHSGLKSAVMCAINYCADKMIAEKKVRNLETQVSLYEVEVKRLKENVSEMKKALSDKNGEASDTVSLPVIDEGAVKNDEDDDECQIKIDDGMPSPNPKEKLRQIEKLLRRGKA